MSDLETRVADLEKKLGEMEPKIEAGACKCSCCTEGTCTCSPKGDDDDECCGGDSCCGDKAGWQDKLLGWVNDNPILAAFLGLLILLVLARIFR